MLEAISDESCHFRSATGAPAIHVAHVDWLPDAGAVWHIVAATQEKGKGSVPLSLWSRKVFVAWDFKGRCFQKADALYRHFVVGYSLKSVCSQWTVPRTCWVALQEKGWQSSSPTCFVRLAEMWRGIQGTCGGRAGEGTNEAVWLDLSYGSTKKNQHRSFFFRSS